MCYPERMVTDSDIVHAQFEEYALGLCRELLTMAQEQVRAADTNELPTRDVFLASSVGDHLRKLSCTYLSPTLETNKSHTMPDVDAALSALVVNGYWTKDRARASHRTVARVIYDYTETRSSRYKVARLGFPSRRALHTQLSRKYGLYHVLSPVKKAALMALCPDQLTDPVVTHRVSYMMCYTQVAYHEAMDPRDEGNPVAIKRGQEEREVQRVLGELVEHHLISAFQALCVSVIVPHWYADQLLRGPTTMVGKAHVARLMCQMIDHERCIQTIPDEEMADLLDDPQNAHLPTSVMFAMVNTGNSTLISEPKKVFERLADFASPEVNAPFSVLSTPNVWGVWR
jgi:hypothetical protein